MLRVVTLASSTGRYGGPFDTALRQCSIANELGYSTTLLAGKEAHDTINIGHPEIRAELHPVSKFVPSKDFTGLFSLKMLRAIHHNVLDADIVHVSISREIVPMVSALITLIFRKKLILQPHGMLTARTSVLHKMIDICIRPAMKAAHGVVALTAVEARELGSLYGICASKIHIIGNPVPPEIEGSQKKDRIKNEALFMARLHPRKRVKDFIDSARTSCSKSWMDSYVVIGPDAGDKSLVEQATQELPNLTYEGALPGSEVTQRLARSSVFVLTSAKEPWGNVLVSALALGIPVVVPSSAALSSMVKKYAAGFVYNDGDIESLTVAVHDLLHNVEVHQKAVDGAHRLSQFELGREALCRKIEMLYS